MNSSRSNATAWGAGHVLGGALLLLAACGQQAGGDYRGEPLLHMRGQAVVSALTGGQPIEPALCFFGADLPTSPEFDLNKLPPEIREKLTFMGSSLVEAPANVNDKHGLATHILGLESRGEFPAQFDVEVYLPPPSAGLSRAWVAGEPRWARGSICAVPTDHPAVTFPFASGGIVDTVDGQMHFAVVSLLTPRFYYEAYACPPGTLPQFAKDECTKTSAGEPDVALEFGGAGEGREYQSESVLGVARSVEVLYLEEPAPAGSFTAWQWGAADGLAAGYHLFATPPPLPEGQPPANLECQIAATDESERRNGEVYNARIKQLFGDDYWYNGLSAYSMVAGGSKPLPEDILLGARENEARLRMQHCPPEPREELDPSAATLSIDISSGAGADLSQHFGQAGIIGE